MRYIIIGFDADGTLTDSSLPHLMAINYVLLKYRKEPLTDLRNFREMNKDYRKLYEELGIKADLNELNRIYRPVFKILVEEWMPSLLPNTEETLTFLSKFARLVLVTSQQREVINLYNKYTNFLRFFKKNNIFLTEDSMGKYLTLKKIKESDPKHQENIYVFISDTPDDLSAAQRAGWKVYGVTTGFSSRENLKNAISPGNGGVLDSLLELKSLFKDLF